MAHKQKLFSIFITLVVIATLLLTGPASAIKLSVKGLQSDYNEGAPVSFTASVDLEDEELIHKDSIVAVEIIKKGDSPENAAARCNVLLSNGTEYCTGGLSLDELSMNANNTNGTYAAYGYGYGYGGSWTSGFNLTDFLDGSSGPGYGYYPGYGYNVAPDYGEISLHLSWTAPSVSSDTEYDVRLFLVRDEDQDPSNGLAPNAYAFMTKETTTFTVKAKSEDGDDDGGDDGGGGSGGGGGGAAPPSTPDEEDENGSAGPEEPVGQTIKELIQNALENKDGVDEQTREQIQQVVQEHLQDVAEKGQNLQVFAGEEAQEKAGNEINLLAKKMGLDAERVAFAAVAEEEESVEVDDLSDEMKETVKQKLAERGRHDHAFKKVTDVKRKVKVTTVTDEDGVTRSVVEMTYEVSRGDHVVEIPKEIAATADQISGTFEVLEDDPVLYFEDTGKISFSVPSNADKLEEIKTQKDNVRVSTLEEPEVKAVSTPKGGDDKQGDDVNLEEKSDKGFGAVVWAIVLIVLLVVIVGLVLLERRGGSRPDYEVK